METPARPDRPRPAIAVRAMRADDAAAIAAIFDCPRAIAGTLQVPLISPDSRAQRTAQTVVDPNVHALVAEVDGRVVGSITLHAYTGTPRRKHVSSFGMAVHDDYAGIGVGTALMEAIVDLADNWCNVHRIELTVWADNEPAIGLYRKFGFEVEGTNRDYGFRDGRYVDALTMARIKPSSE